MRSSSGPAFGQQPVSGHRLPQLVSLIQRELGSLLPRELELPAGVLLTVTKVEVVDDLSAARVGVSVLPYAHRAEAFELLIQARRTLQQAVNEHLKLYRVPKLEFYLDESAERAASVERLLDKLA